MKLEVTALNSMLRVNPILSDCGAPLSDDISLKEAIPPVTGIQDGSNPNLLALLFPIRMLTTTG